MAQPHLLLRLLAASLAFNLALAQTLLVQITGTGVNIARPGVAFPTAPAGFDPPVNATAARAVLDAIEVRDPDVDESTRTVEVRRSDSAVWVTFQCPAGQYGMLMWAPLYTVVWGHVVPGGESFEVWFVTSNIPGESPLSSEYRVDCFD